ncbi:MAG TPA: O-antigen ligase family protein [Desulfosporosinus sp.]|nr:O-antigen ligase family protein [Desulfosporosinus sp.]
MTQRILNSLKLQPKSNSRLNVLVYIVLIEMVLGGSGRVITAGPLTLKYALFLIALIYFAVATLTIPYKIDERNMFYGPVFVFLALLFLSIANGLLHGYPVGDVLSATQGYLYLLMILPFTLFINKIEQVREVLRVINASALVLAILSIIIFIFLYIAPAQVYSIVNPFLVNTSYGALEPSGVLPRVFFRTDPFIALAFIHELFTYVNRPDQRTIRSIVKMVILLIGCLTTMTMGLWVALGVGIALCIAFSPGKNKLYMLLVMMFVAMIIFIPFANSIQQIVLKRFSQSDSSFIIKLDQLYTMLNVWIHNFFFGTGYGVKIIFDNGVMYREITKFELSWLELLVCMGITGFTSFSYILTKTFLNGLRAASLSAEHHAIQIKAMITGVIMLCVISLVNPFLNNPIGLGYLIIVMCSVNVYYKTLNRTQSSEKSEARVW